MFQELKKKTLKYNLVFILVLAVVGIVLIGSRISSLFLLLSGKDDLDVMTADEIRPGMYVEGTVWGIYDYYASTTETKNGVSSTVSCEYIIPVGEAEYMGMVAPKKYMEDCDALMEESWDYLDGLTEEITGQFKVTGTITDMDSESLKFYREYLVDYAGYDELSEEEQEAFLPYYLMIGYVGESKFSDVIGLSILGLGLLAAAIALLVWSLTGGGQKALKKYCRENGAEAKLEQFYQSTAPLHGLRISREFILGEGLTTLFLPAGELLWAYMQVTTHKKYGVITTGKTYCVMLYTREGKCRQHNVRKEEQAKEILNRINAVLPWVILGYSDELRNAYAKNRAELIRTSDERRAETEFSYNAEDGNSAFNG